MVFTQGRGFAVGESFGWSCRSLRLLRSFGHAAITFALWQRALVLVQFHLLRVIRFVHGGDVKTSRWRTLAILESDTNPYDSPPAMAPSAQDVTRPRLGLYVAFWFIGTFLLSALVIADELTSTRLPGALFYVTMALSAIIVVVTSIAAPVSAGYKALAILASVVLFPMQMVAIGVLSLVFTGLEGTQ